MIRSVENRAVFIRLLLFVALVSVCSCRHEVPGTCVSEAYSYKSLISDTIFDSDQQIHIISLPQGDTITYDYELVHDFEVLRATSELAIGNDAEVALNGSFFDVDHGGSVTFVEQHDSLVYQTRKKGLPWAMSPNIINGAVQILKNGKVQITEALPEHAFLESDDEESVLVSGPLLLLDGELQKITKNKFSRVRHPRTCLCLTSDSVKFIVVDGRSPNADGMTLFELQQVAQELNCVSALNLDGGGSSTLWLIDCGVVNEPSDWSGERPVANALVMLKRRSSDK